MFSARNKTPGTMGKGIHAAIKHSYRIVTGNRFLPAIEDVVS